MLLRNTRSGELMITGCQIMEYQDDFSATDFEESGIWEDHE
jgi:hypothetical protein